MLNLTGDDELVLEIMLLYSVLKIEKTIDIADKCVQL
jgi:hypothetical protein